MLIMQLILPFILYNIVIVIVALLFPLPALVITLIGAAITLLLLLYPYRYLQRRRGITPSISFRFDGCLPFLLLMGIGICIAVNNIISLTPLPELSPGFESVSESIYSAPFPVQILATVIVIPAVEEMIFRGFVFAPLRERFSFLRAAVISALLFGLYHGNLIQGIYAFLLGIVMAWLYERFRTIAAPYLFHLAANLMSVAAVNTSVGILTDGTNMALFAASTIISAVVCVVCFVKIRKTR